MNTGMHNVLFSNTKKKIQFFLGFTCALFRFNFVVRKLNKQEIIFPVLAHGIPNAGFTEVRVIPFIRNADKQYCFFHVGFFFFSRSSRHVCHLLARSRRPLLQHVRFYNLFELRGCLFLKLRNVPGCFSRRGYFLPGS